MKSLDVVRWETDNTVEVVFAKYDGEVFFFFNGIR